MKAYTKEEAIQKSKEYFEGDELAAEVFVTKYALRNDKLELLECSPDMMHRRLAKEFARIEQKYPNPLSEEEIFNLLDHYRYIVAQGSPMFGIGNPYQRTSISNCFALDVADSYGGICRADERIAQISKRRGGCGLDISSLRPKGLPTKNSALTTDGIVVFMQRFSNTSREVAQAGRRGALLLSISVHHPEVLNFIRSKMDLNKVTGANISVKITDEFMDALKKDKTYEQRWPVEGSKPVISQEVKAKEVWDEIIRCAHRSGEPGILFIDTIQKNSPADSYSDLGYKSITTNPCLTGETLVYVADGRGNVPIKQLANEGRDVPVFCYDNKGKVIIRTMRNPRITGYKKRIYKVTLDNNCVIRCTENHKFRMKDGSYKTVSDLIKGDSLSIITRFEASIKDFLHDSRTRSGDYYWINNGFSSNVAEHRIIASHFLNKNKTIEGVIHHIDYNTKNNNYKNLRIMSCKEHNKLHSRRMMGDNNPMRRAKTEWNQKKWNKYHQNMSIAVSGDKNGRYLGITNEDLLQKAVNFSKLLGRRFSKKEWQSYARKNNLPIEFSKWRGDYFGGILGMSKLAATICGFDYIHEDPRTVRIFLKMKEQGYECKIENGMVLVKKCCEECKKDFWINYSNREIGFCNLLCAHKSNKMTGMLKKESLKDNQCSMFTLLKNKLNRMPLRKEWKQICRENNISSHFGDYGFKSYSELCDSSEYFNHRVVSIELDSIEDVYNGTVDEFHNFFVGGFQSLTKNGKQKWIYINNKNCGELPLGGNLGSCILLLQNLLSYVENPFTDKAKFNEELFKKNTFIAQKLIDDMVDIELECIDRIIEKIKSDPEDDKTKANELDLWMSVRKTCNDSRRTGLGITALGDCIAALNIKYGSKESIKIVETIYSILRNEAYRSSIQMANDRGAFPIWDAKKEKDNEFLNRLPEDILKDMRKYGRRNIACLTTSPAGSVSTQTQTSSGFEPVFMIEYVRKRKLTENDKDKPDYIDNSGDKWKEYKIEHNGLKLFKKITGKEYKDSPYFGSLASEIDYEARVKMQAVATQYTCHAISSTINLPNDIDIKTVDSIYKLAYKEGCKGLTVYRDGSRDGVLTKTSTKTKDCEDCDEASKILGDLVRQGQRPQNIILSPAPKRPEIVECEIQRSKVGGGDWLFFIGMFGNSPYEVFGGDAEEFTIPHKYKKGWIIKNGKNKDGITQYNLVLGSLDDPNEKLEFRGIAKHFNNKEYGAFTRVISLCLRHGVPIKYISQQLLKTGCAGDLFSFQRAMARVLKKYIVDGEKSGGECPMCHSEEIYYKNGCPTCKICGHSTCS